MDAQKALAALLEKAEPGLDGEALSHGLFRRYGSLATILNAPEEDLLSAGLKLSTVYLLHMMPSLARYTHLEKFGTHPDLSTLKKAEEYLSALFTGRDYEHLYLLCLSPDGRLNKTALVTRGTLNETAFYLRNMVEEALRAKAHAVVITHNHPGGTAAPSPGDIAATQQAIYALSKIEIPVLDHVIIADSRALSLRASGLIEETKFINQAPKEPLLLGWLR